GARPPSGHPPGPPQVSDRVENGLGDGGLGCAGDVVLAAGSEDRDLVGVGIEADVAARDVVDDHGIQALLLELAAAVLDRARSVLGGEADQSLPVAALGGQPAKDVSGRLELQAQALL